MCVCVCVYRCCLWKTRVPGSVKEPLVKIYVLSINDLPPFKLQPMHTHAHTHNNEIYTTLNSAKSKQWRPDFAQKRSGCLVLFSISFTWSLFSSVLNADRSSGLRPPLAPTRKRKDFQMEKEGQTCVNVCAKPFLSPNPTWLFNEQPWWVSCWI